MSDGAVLVRPRASPGLVARSFLFNVWIYGLGLVMGIVCLPLLLGTKDVAFPRVNIFSFYIFFS